MYISMVTVICHHAAIRQLVDTFQEQQGHPVTSRCIFAYQGMPCDVSAKLGCACDV